MGRPARVDLETIIESYQRTRSVWKTGKEVGLGGQSVHERLRAAGHPLGHRPWTEDELEEVSNLSISGVPLGEIATRMGRTYAAVASQLSLRGVKSSGRRGRTKIPRGAGYDKESIRKHIKSIDSYDGPITRYARASGLNLELLVKAIQRDRMDWWEQYVSAHSDLPLKKCTYCDTEFVPSTGRQQFCNRKCSTDNRQDQAYFGGQRRTTVGLSEGVCQLCQRKPERGLSSHHVLGKENDPENEILVALCSGCHQVVTLLGARPFVDDPIVWQSLISLAWFRRHGATASRDLAQAGLYVEVILEVEDIDQEH